MRIELEATGHFEQFHGITCRMWKGKTGEGTPIEAMIPCIRVAAAENAADLERELNEIKAVRQLTSFDTRLV
jgi:hypothetical protein